MDNTYYVAEIKKGANHRVFLFEVEKTETLEDIVIKNFGEDAILLRYRLPTAEEHILMRRGMKT
ncbi:MAG: hypothetical protein IJT32_03645 [Lachnospiraceae bacterium]|nr:hypothetical protein [Lachnospiraceae bacterium]